MRFAVRSLGWVQISEDDLVPEKSSRSVNKCIVGLSLGKNDLNDVVGRWGDVGRVNSFLCRSISFIYRFFFMLYTMKFLIWNFVYL